MRGRSVPVAAEPRVSSGALAPPDHAGQAAYVGGVKKYFSGSVFAPAGLDRYCLASEALAACAAAPAVK